MEVHSPVNSVLVKRLWNILRIAFFMLRKGLISKRKLLMDMYLMMKRGKLLRKTLGNLIFPHPQRSPHGFSDGPRFGLQEYEFSCYNSPNPVFLHVAKRKYHYLNFPCINYPPSPSVDEESDAHKEDILVSLSPNNNNNNNELSPEPSYHHPYCFRLQTPTPDLAPAGEVVSPLLLSPFAVRISSYSEEDENEPNSLVDDAAEEFIRKFYEQLRMQSRTQLLQYQEEMLARGTG
ncbi:uncharacterized protein LOC122076813 [Macadamia integrifolia]|uniref:uncharacterized protein LOC122076813 n=1 Tax=Macadamia integrifolia TaxID=60698 RepID=UPI001C4E3E15|nr:uncharacterized protein LOC122076813 [Macadamia integrifolia]